MKRWLIEAIVVAAIIIIVTWFFWLRLKSPQSVGTESPKSIIPASGSNGQEAPAKPVAGGGATESRIDESKWVEARAAMGVISTAIRAYHVEVGPDGQPPRDIGALGITPQDLDGRYFGAVDYAIAVSSMNPLTFTITCTPGAKHDAPKYPAKRTLDSKGKWGPE
jgi:hypothetical protein